MKKRFLFPAIILLISAGLGVFAFFWWRQNSRPISVETKEAKDFLVLKGRGAGDIGQKLYQEKIIRNPLAFKIYVQVTGKEKKLQAGEYRLSPNLNLQEVVEHLTGPPLQLWVTIPEGQRREEVVENFIEDLGMNSEDALNFQSNFISASEGKEGYLFPDTYLLPKEVSAQQAIGLMENTFNKKTADIAKGSSKSGLNFDQVVVLASLIEREASSDDERALIAGILLNRINIGMPLQVDAAVQFAVASRDCTSEVDCNWWPILTRRDLEIDSPYNTYKYLGLPPGPIASPGVLSLKGAASPQDNDYLYYIHDKEGQIHYAKTLEAHNQNVRLYLGK